jgi:hypothetical protein
MASVVIPRSFRLTAAIILAAFVLLGHVAMQPTVYEAWDLWMVSMPLGYELDVQRNVDSGAWAVYWLAPDGTSTKLAGGR